MAKDKEIPQIPRSETFVPPTSEEGRPELSDHDHYIAFGVTKDGEGVLDDEPSEVLPGDERDTTIAPAGEGEILPELPLDDSRGKGGPPVFSEFGHAHDKKLIAQAIEDRLPQLRKLEKANVDQGYMREARVVKGDADRLHDVLLKAFQGDEQLALDAVPGPTEVRSGIANNLHNLIRRYVRDSIGPEDNPAVDFENEICQRVERFTRAVAEISYAAGYRDRAEHPHAFMLRCLGQLEHSELKGAEG